jgi:hypothetical protein
MDLSLNGSSKFNVDKFGNLTIPSLTTSSITTNLFLANNSTGISSYALTSGGPSSNVYWSPVVRSVANGAGLLGGTITNSGTLSVKAGQGVSVNANGVNTIYTLNEIGSSTQYVDKKLGEAVSPYDFGADGTGLIDDTEAFQAALNTSRTRIFIPPGTFLISNTLTSSVSNRTIEGPGVITAASSVNNALIVTGNNSIISVNVSGNNKIIKAITVQNSTNVVVERCKITDLYTNTQFSAGIFLSNTINGAIVRNNIISRVNANGSFGESSGRSRGIAIGYSDTAAIGDTIIENNYIQDIIGAEGDSIAAVAGGGGSYYDLNITIRDNDIRNFTRRAVKTQGNNVRVLNNYITNNWANADVVPNAATVIDFVQGGDVTAQGNKLNKCEWFNQISVYTVDTDIVDNVFITKNIITGLGNTHYNNIISIGLAGTAADYGKGLVITDNIIDANTLVGKAISIGKSFGSLISGNYISIGSNSTVSVITLSSNAVSAVIKDNILLKGNRESFIQLSGRDCIVTDNHVKSNTSIFSNPSGGGNHLFLNNTFDGSGSLYDDLDTFTGNRFGGNYNLKEQTNPAPGPLYVFQGAGPSVVLSGLYVRIGQIVFDSSPEAGGKIGWVATTSGDANTVTWKQFGLIDT